MLVELSISNYAIIDHLVWQPEAQFNILTGETGAGKSILVGALGLLLGVKVNSASLPPAPKKTIIEGHFEVIWDDELINFFDEKEIEKLNPIILRREVSAEGRSRAFINDSPVKLDELQFLAENLIDIHSQNDNRLLETSVFQTQVLDTFGKNLENLALYKNELAELKKLSKQREELEKRLLDFKIDQQRLQSSIKEFEALDPKKGEYSELEQELALLENSADLTEKLSLLNGVLNEDEGNLNQQLRKATTLAERISSIIPNGQEWENRLRNCLSEIKDLSMEVSLTASDLPTYSLERVDQINAKLFAYEKLQRTYLLNSPEEVYEKFIELKERNQSPEQLKELLDAAQKAEESQKKITYAVAEKVSKNRLKASKVLPQLLVKDLQRVGILNAELSIELIPNDGLQKFGLEWAQFMFTANKGVRKEPLKAVASGGEKSRLMLCLKQVMSKQNKSNKTYIFDEIDTGISGEVAIQVGKLLAEMAISNQLICITHLPQVAAAGNSHYFISKGLKEGRTTTQISKLSLAEREIEIATMMSGKSSAGSALVSAKNLINLQSVQTT